MDFQTLILITAGCGALALVFAWLRGLWIGRQDAGDATMQRIAAHIREGAMAFLGREYRVLAVFVVVVAAALALLNARQPGSSPLIGLSVIAQTGNIYAGLYYPIAVALLTFVVGSLALPETHAVRIWEETTPPAASRGPEDGVRDDHPLRL